MRVILFFIVILISSFAGVRAQNDPVLAGMIYSYTEKAEKELKNQEKVMPSDTLFCRVRARDINRTTSFNSS